MKILIKVLGAVAVVLLVVTIALCLILGEAPTPENVRHILTGKEVYDNYVNDAQNEDKKFVFSAQRVGDVAEEALPAADVQTIYLCVEDNYYFPVEVPADVEIVTDYYKYIYAKDSTFYVTVLSNIAYEELSMSAGIRNAVSVSPNLVRSEVGRKGAQEAAKHVLNDKVVIVRCYNNPVAFATILNSMKQYTYANMAGKTVLILPKENDTDTEYTKVLTQIPQATGYHLSVEVGMLDTVQQFYVYDDGFVTTAREFKLWDEAVERMKERIAVCTGQEYIDKYYADNDKVYIECGRCTVGIVRVNYNTVITLFGIGEEAKYNVEFYLRTYE